MKYTPKMVTNHTSTECAIGEAKNLVTPGIIRAVPVSSFEVSGDSLFLKTDALTIPLTIGVNTLMRFGTESITAIEYFRRVMERGDLIDALILPCSGNAIPMIAYWIHIKYVGKPLKVDSYAKKDDGLFALRAKAGEKAERFATRVLKENYGHHFTDALCISPGYFEIRYANKKQRLPDRKCAACGLTLEVKKRNRDTHFRVSHSKGRSFISENKPNGWHAFVFSDMKPRFVPNSDIIQAIAQGDYLAGSDQYDTWADVDTLNASDPPYCKRR